MQHKITCKNCNHHFEGHFCNNCGQSVKTHDINFHYFWHEIQHGILHFDTGFFYTVKQLFTRPGHAIRDFVDGKRVKYFKPLAFLFLLSTIYGLLAHYFKLQTFIDGIQIKQTGGDTEETKDVINSLTRSFSWLQTHYAYATLLYLPLTSVASYLAFRKKGGNYLKHIVLNTYVTGQQTIVYLFIIPVLVLSNKPVINSALQIQTLLGIVLTTWTYSQYFNYNSVLKNILLTLLSYIYLLLTLFLSLLLFFMLIKAL